MTPNATARTAGILYLTVAATSGLAELNVRAAAHDATSAAGHLAANDTLWKLALAADLIGIAAFLLLAMAFHRLLADTGKGAAAAMVTFVAVAVAIMATNLVNHAAALAAATDTRILDAFGTDGADALAAMFLDLHAAGFAIAQLFFGLWLLPLGHLAYKSRRFPPALGILLMIGCAAYLVELAIPGNADDIIALPAAVAEIWMVIYLLVFGIRPTPAT